MTRTCSPKQHANAVLVISDSRGNCFIRQAEGLAHSDHGAACKTRLRVVGSPRQPNHRQQHKRHERAGPHKTQMAINVCKTMDEIFPIANTPAPTSRNPHCTGAGLEDPGRPDRDVGHCQGRNPHCTGAGLEVNMQRAKLPRFSSRRNPHCTGAGLEEVVEGVKTIFVGTSQSSLYWSRVGRMKEQSVCFC